MTVTERERRRMELVDGSAHRTELCELLALREFELDNLKKENAKLRELVKKLVILAFARCANCDLLDASCVLVPTQKCLLWNECESIARELGMEVDDG